MEIPSDRRRRLNREQQQRWRARQRDDRNNRLRAENSQIAAILRSNESDEQTEALRAANSASQARRRENANEEQVEARRAADLASHARRRGNESEEQAEARRAEDLASHAMRRENRREANSRFVRINVINFNENTMTEHSCGPMDVTCQFCGSKNFTAERPSDGKFTSCCRKGKFRLQQQRDENGAELQYPDFLRQLMSNPSNPRYRHFRDSIRSYNSAVSFASMGANLVDLHERGPYVFKVHGQTYHRTSHIRSVNNQRPQFAQLYVIDSTQANEIRSEHPANEKCLPEILDQIDRFFRHHNRLAHSYKMLRDIQAEAMPQGNGDVPIVNMIFRRDRRSDQRRYNIPNANEIAMVFVDNDGEPPFDRDIRVYPINPQDPQQCFINISILSPNLDPMSYALLFPYGEPGWQANWRSEAYDGAEPNRSRVNVTMLQYKVALTAMRANFNPFVNAGKLTQQWIVDSYLQVEANNLNFIRQHQVQLRREMYEGLNDFIENAAQNVGVRPGRPVILPSSFEGSPRNMRERCADAMSIFAKYGPPDLFVTFTANPKWIEIIDNLLPGEQTCDRPDLVARVFKIKLKALLEDLTSIGIFGKSIAHVYTIEFQKRGLPHAHILITLRTEDKFTSAESIDQTVCAEIPNESENLRLYEVVIRCMVHGPCGAANPHASCMENGLCKKKFPKDFRLSTKHNENGYPLYRRRPYTSAVVRGCTVDNRYVVPYNPYLLLKFNAHINVELCTSLRAIKYIYKYIYKGFDSANIVINAQHDAQLQYDEISNFINCRYVSAPEAMWRLLQSPMHERSHSVMRLPVHLPNQQLIFFEPGREEEALEAARSRRTKLEAWFSLNATDADAQQLHYTEIPYHYVFVRNNWQRRQRGSSHIVTRMYVVGIREEERFYLRMLLLHIPGATSFEFLRSVDGVVYNTFKEAASHRHLLESDEEWNRCLQESAAYQMPHQMRQTFAFICCFCMPSNIVELWNNHHLSMMLDYQRNNDETDAFNMALADINSVLLQHGLSCAAIGLPTPSVNPIEVPSYDRVREEHIAEQMINSFNPQQSYAFNKIVNAINDDIELNRFFYLDGPGGSGKTYLYSALLSYIRGRGSIALPFATTGIAATLLKGGRTVHSGFKLPIPLLDTSVSSMKGNSTDAMTLRQASLIIIDEITMLTKYGLQCIDKLLRELMQNQWPFGGKVFVIGGDFRQTLPIVPRGARIDIVQSCIKSCSLWRQFTKLTLTTNMRSEGQDSHNQWLLNIGSGNMPHVPGLPENSIFIPEHMTSDDNLINEIYGQDVINMPIEDLAKRVILAPTNKETLGMNKSIIQKLPGELRLYHSADSIVSEDINDMVNYPPEFLHDQTPSGMPPHTLGLKTRTILMLLRNLDPKKGLCNGTRLIVMSLQNNSIVAEIVSECHRGDIVVIPRINLQPSDTNLPFILKRRQFPVLPAYAMTINKSQGQTFDYVGIYLNEPVFSHGQLYVAMSRSRNAHQVKVYIKTHSLQGNVNNIPNQFTQNIVFREVFHN